MKSSRYETWKREGSIGILSLPGFKGHYLHEPEFIPLERLVEFFGGAGLKGGIIRGSGRHFSAGADLDRLSQIAKEETVLFTKMTAGKNLIRFIEDARLPVIAEISGACFGGGLEIALACHIRICSENALFAFPEVNLGIIPGLGGTVSLSKVIGAGKAVEMILSGDAISGDKALEMKLVDYIVPGKELHDFTRKYLEKLTNDRDVEVIRAIMESIRHGQVMETDKALQEETRLFCALAVRNMQT